jgi:hypothetical protein
VKHAIKEMKNAEYDAAKDAISITWSLRFQIRGIDVSCPYSGPKYRTDVVVDE